MCSYTFQSPCILYFETKFSKKLLMLTYEFFKQKSIFKNWKFKNIERHDFQLNGYFWFFSLSPWNYLAIKMYVIFSLFWPPFDWGYCYTRVQNCLYIHKIRFLRYCEMLFYEFVWSICNIITYKYKAKF